MRGDPSKSSIVAISKEIYTLFTFPLYPTRLHPLLGHTRLVLTVFVLSLLARGYVDLSLASWRMPLVLILYLLHLLNGGVFVGLLRALTGRTASYGALSRVYFGILGIVFFYTTFVDLAVYLAIISIDSIKTHRFLVPLADIIFIGLSIYFVILCGYTLRKIMERKPKRYVPSFVLSILVVPIILFFVTKTAFFDPTICIFSKSMFPTLRVGDYILVNRLAYLFREPGRGQVVLFSLPGKEGEYVKRIVAVASDTVMIKDKRLYVNGGALKERYIYHGLYLKGVGKEYEERKIEEKKVFVLGDNRGDSHDSRSFGPIPVDCIKGKAVLVWYPLRNVKMLR
ncbi:MAG: signal peptidase I [Pseudomonadota bacterium]